MLLFFEIDNLSGSWVIFCYSATKFVSVNSVDFNCFGDGINTQRIRFHAFM